MGTEEIKSIFGNKIRVRVMGLLKTNGQLLMINHAGLNSSNELWLPPGGGVEFGETVNEALKREFKEETGLEIEVGKFLGVYELISDYLHAIELIFVVDQIGGNLQLGLDPEMEGGSILKEMQWMSIQDLKNKDRDCLHGLFLDIDSLDDLFAKHGFFNIGNNP